LGTDRQRVAGVDYFRPQCWWNVLGIQRDDEVGISVLGTITNVIVVRVSRKIAGRGRA
jgi:hypothetical protein